MREVEDDPVRPPAVALPAGGAGLREEGRDGAGEAVEGHLEELHLLRRDVVRELGAVREPVHGRQGQGDEADARGELPAGNRRPEPGDVPRGGDEGDEVPAPRQLLGELEERHDVAEGEPWEHHDVKRRFLPGIGFGHER